VGDDEWTDEDDLDARLEVDRQAGRSAKVKMLDRWWTADELRVLIAEAQKHLRRLEGPPPLSEP
jgi:hypothetical protein